MNPWKKKKDTCRQVKKTENKSSWKQTVSTYLNKELNNGVGENQLLNREAAALYREY